MDWRGVARSRFSMRGMAAIATTREMPSRMMGGKRSLDLHRPVLRTKGEKKKEKGAVEKRASRRRRDTLDG